MDIINLYFGKIVFVKVDLREDHAIYAAALSSSYQDGRKQYAMAFIPNHLAVLTRGYLSDLSWVNLQTRTMTTGYKMPPQRWEIPKGLPTPMFSLQERTENKSRYFSDEYPLEMVLIHDPKKKSKYQYHSHMNLLAALVTFKCVISLLDVSTPQSRGPLHPGQYPGQYPSQHPSQHQYGSPPQQTPIHQYGSPPQQTPMQQYGSPPQQTPMQPHGSQTSMHRPQYGAPPQQQRMAQTPFSGIETYSSETRYTPLTPSGPYATIGLPEYGVPQAPPSQPLPPKQSISTLRNVDPTIEFL